MSSLNLIKVFENFVFEGFMPKSSRAVPSSWHHPDEISKVHLGEKGIEWQTLLTGNWQAETCGAQNFRRNIFGRTNNNSFLTTWSSLPQDEIDIKLDDQQNQLGEPFLTVGFEPRSNSCFCKIIPNDHVFELGTGDDHIFVTTDYLATLGHIIASSWRLPCLTSWLGR